MVLADDVYGRRLRSFVAHLLREAHFAADLERIELVAVIPWPPDPTTTEPEPEPETVPLDENGNPIPPEDDGEVDDGEATEETTP